MRQFLHLLERFRQDERGAFALIFGVMAIVLVAMSGAAVDFTVMQRARTRAQVALDAAALALQPTIYTDTAASIQTKAQALLVSQLADAGTTWANCSSNGNKAPCATVTTPIPDTTNGQLTLVANVKVPMSFVSLVGVQNITAGIQSVATRKKLNLEVAMVLDNSNSMSTSFGSGTRMSTLIAAAKCAMNVLFNNDCNSTATTSTAINTSIAIVPFTMEVNVGTSNASATWLDRTGSSTGSITDNNFDDNDYDGDTFSGPVDRISLFSQIKNGGASLSWGGCVEARKEPYDTDDTTPTTTNRDTLFTPFFAPDEPDSGGFSNNYISDKPSACKPEPTVVWKQVKTKCSYAASGYSAASNYNRSCGGSTTNTYTETDRNGIVTYPSSLPSSIYNNPVPSSSTQDTYYTSGSGNTITNERDSTYTYVYSQREYQERLCKYSNAPMTSSPNQGNAHGPNSDCPTNAILPLSSTKSSVLAAINLLSPQGGTNIHAGVEWGFHVLSPSEPFTQALPFDSADSKVMIVMTDGENTAYQTGNMNDSTYYSYYGFPYNARMGTATSTNAQLVAEMNRRTLATCTNAKAAGITVYTVGVATNATNDPTTNINLLKSCATDTGKAYFPNNATDLIGDFQDIANQLAALRLAK
jgi:Flp pilus assembly protein TadG